MVTGGYAVAWYGYPRYTGDIDFWVEASLENGEKLEQVFIEFGLSSFGIKATDFAAEEKILQIGYPPHRIDIITSIDGVEFSSAYASKQHIEIDGIPVDLISLEDLKANKKASGRPKDLDDLNNLA